MTENRITLRTLNDLIRSATENAFPDAIWVVAEILEMQVNRSGHCYMELVEKSESDHSIVARTRATIWASRFGMVRSYFEASTMTALEPGIKVLLKVQVSYHPVYGLSLNITDIDPAFTMGDMARRKLEVLNKLKEAGVMEMNRDLAFPLVPQQIAVISSETAAGFGDFVDSLLNNSYNISFRVELYPALVQGDGAEESIISAFEKIYASGKHYDAVVLIRGGGSQADLDCFNGFDLAMNIAQFPLPVLTGIGHERDETIADLVAYMSLKTPTAVAEFILDSVLEFTGYLEELQGNFEKAVTWIIQKESMELRQKTSDLQYLTQLYLNNEKHELSGYGNSLSRVCERRISAEKNQTGQYLSKIDYLMKGIGSREKHSLEMLQTRFGAATRAYFRNNQQVLNALYHSVELLRPEKVLARGYSISYSEGKLIKSVKDLKTNMKLDTILPDGRISSAIEKITPKNK